MSNFEYPKTNNIFARGSKSAVTSDFLSETIENMQGSGEFIFEEKVDGSNFRVFIDDGEVEYKGRTENTQFTSSQWDAAKSIIEPHAASLKRAFAIPVVLYGELYGGKIQSPWGLRYRPDGSVGLIFFDVRYMRSGSWLLRSEWEPILSAAQLQCVPVFNFESIKQAVAKVREGLHSSLACNDPFISEGIVAKDRLGRLDRWGNRIMCKIKTRDLFDENSNRQD